MVDGDTLRVDVHFRDSHLAVDAAEDVLHEYTLQATVDPSSLARRNLLRGRSMGLPSGQAVARKIGVEVVPDDHLRVGKATEADVTLFVPPGVAREVAERYEKELADLFLTASVTLTPGEKAAAETGATFCQANVLDDASLDAAFDKARSANGQERVLISCAGGGRRAGRRSP